MAHSFITRYCPLPQYEEGEGGEPPSYADLLVSPNHALLSNLFHILRSKNFIALLNPESCVGLASDPSDHQCLPVSIVQNAAPLEDDEEVRLPVSMSSGAVGNHLD
jgi:hypothetical protein